MAYIWFQLNFQQKAKLELSEYGAEYVLKLGEYFWNLAEMVMRLHNKRSCGKVSKALAKFKKVFGFKLFLICLLPEV